MPSVGEMSSARDALRMAGAVLQLGRALDQQLRGASHPTPLSVVELSVLGQIDRGAATPTGIARALRLDPARVTHVTDRLVAHAYVERESDPSDRRRWRLHLTPLGQERLIAGRGDVALAMATVLEGLSEDESADLARGLAGVRRVLDLGYGVDEAVAAS